jgi:integrase
VSKLTDTTIRNAKPKPADYKLSDGLGLILVVRKGGSKLWQVRYTLHGQERSYSPGPYPSVTLGRARVIAAEVKAAARAGSDPVALRQEARKDAASDAAQTFTLVARDWIKRRTDPTRTDRWRDGYASQITTRDLVGTADAPGWFQTLRDQHGPTARAVCQYLADIFDHADRQELMGDRKNPAHRLRETVAKIVKVPRPAATDLRAARAVLAAIEGQNCHAVLKLAHRFMVLTSVRVGEMRGALWSEMSGIASPDVSEATWSIPAHRMKMKRGHVVPLSAEAVAVLRAARTLRMDDNDLIFSCSGRGRQIGVTTMNSLYYRVFPKPMKQVPHGWRATFNTIMVERHPADRLPLDLMLAHVAGNSRAESGVSSVESIYNRASFVDRRRQLAKIWAGLILDGAKSAAELTGLATPVTLRQKAA